MRFHQRDSIKEDFVHLKICGLEKINKGFVKEQLRDGGTPNIYEVDRPRSILLLKEIFLSLYKLGYLKNGIEEQVQNQNHFTLYVQVISLDQFWYHRTECIRKLHGLVDQEMGFPYPCHPNSQSQQMSVTALILVLNGILMHASNHMVHLLHDSPETSHRT